MGFTCADSTGGRGHLLEIPLISMKTITHDWNGKAITQLTKAITISKHDVPLGYVNATQMCHAQNKSKASSLCRKENIDVERIHDPRFGYVGLYPESVLIQVFSGT